MSCNSTRTAVGWKAYCGKLKQEADSSNRLTALISTAQRLDQQHRLGSHCRPQIHRRAFASQCRARAATTSRRSQVRRYTRFIHNSSDLRAAATAARRAGLFLTQHAQRREDLPRCRNASSVVCRYSATAASYPARAISESRAACPRRTPSQHRRTHSPQPAGRRVTGTQLPSRPIAAPRITVG